MTTLAVTSVNSLLCHVSTCLRIGSKFRCIRSTPTEMQSMSENDFECFASTRVNTPVKAMSEQQRFWVGDAWSRQGGSFVPTRRRLHSAIAEGPEVLLVKGAVTDRT